MERDAERTDAALPPTGTVAFLYTDIEGSSGLHERHPEKMAFCHGVHNRFVTDAIAAHGGHAYRCTGDGFCAAFATAEAALGAAMAAQRALGNEAWDDDLTVRARMAVFVGPVEWRDGEYHGRTLSRGSRLLGAAHGGQTLLNRATVELLPERAPPGVEMRELGAYVLHGTGREETIFQAVPEGCSQGFPPLVTHKGAQRVASPPPGAETSPFFGRRREIRDLQRLLALKNSRLVTVTGLGGMGKSRLAQEVARRLAPAFPDGAITVRCEPIRGREELAAALAEALGLPGTRSEPERAVAAALRERRTLVVLDGFEGLSAHAEAVATWVAASPGSRFLVTSRWPLGIPLEADYPLDPLDCGEGAAGPAAKLFATAAIRADPRFRSARESAAVARICAKLEGMPLALLVAASCLKWCSLQALEGLIGSDLLDVTGPERSHVSLRNVIDASVRALPEGDGAFLKRLVVFGDAFAIDDVAQVLQTARPLALGRLARLREYTLIQPVSDGKVPHFRLLMPVREALLGDDLPEADLRRHVGWATKRAEAVRATMERGEWAQGSQTFLRNLPDFRAAMEAATGFGDDGAVCALARNLCRPALEMGLWSDFDRWVGLAHPRAQLTGDWPFVMSLLGLEGARAQRAHDYELARERWSARLSLAERTGDAEKAADAEFDLANLAWAQQDRVAMAHHLKRVRERISHGSGILGIESLVLVLEAVLACDVGDDQSARRNAEEAIRLGANSPKQHAFSFVSLHGGSVLRRVGDRQEAETILKRLLVEATHANKVYEAANAFLELGRLYVAASNFEAAGVAVLGCRMLYDVTGRRYETVTEEITNSPAYESNCTPIHYLISKFHVKNWKDVTKIVESDIQ